MNDSILWLGLFLAGALTLIVGGMVLAAIHVGTLLGAFLGQVAPVLP